MQNALNKQLYSKMLSQSVPGDDEKPDQREDVEHEAGGGDCS